MAENAPKSEVWVFAQLEQNRVAEITLELLGKGRELADRLEVPLGAVLLGSRVGELSRDLIAHGAGTVYLVQHRELDAYTTLPYTRTLVDLVRRFEPAGFILGATALGRDLAPRVASQLKVGITADCTDLAIDHYTRYVFDHFDEYSDDVCKRREAIDKINEMERWLNEEIRKLVHGTVDTELLNPQSGNGHVRRSERTK